MLIRERRITDVPACVHIMALTHDAGAYPAHWPADPAAFLVSDMELAAWVACDDDGQPVGHVALHDAAHDPSFGPIQAATGAAAQEFSVVARLIVDPRFQGLGVGRALLDGAVAHSQQLDRHPILDVVKTSAGAIAFYEALGWHRFGSVEIEIGDLPSLSTWVYAAPGLTASNRPAQRPEGTKNP